VHGEPEKENVGSSARDHLANERTYLAWLRTAIGLVGIGVVVSELAQSREPVLAELIGIGMIVLGVFSLVYAYVRYRQVTRQLEMGRFRAAGYGPFVITLVTLAGMVAVAVYLLT
jgi:putative membrane protein